MNIFEIVNKIEEMKILTFSTMKGGVGKTTNAVNLAKRLSDFARVLLIDGDPSGNASANLMPYDEDGNGLWEKENELINIFRGESVTPLAVNENLDLIVGTHDLHDIEAELANKKIDKVKILHNWIKRSKLHKFYDFIVIDTHNDKGLITQNAYYTSDLIVSSCEPDEYAVSGFTSAYELLVEMKIGYVNYDDELEKEISQLKADIVLLGSNVGSDTLSKAFIRDVKDIEEYVGSVPRGVVFPKANLQHSSVYDLAKKGEYARKRYIPFFEKVDAAYAAVLSRLIS